MPHDPLLPRHVSPERAQAWDDALRARLAGAPPGSVPYTVWSRQVDDLCRERNIRLARPEDFTSRFSPSTAVEGERLPAEALAKAGAGVVTIEALLAYQETFYRDAYKDPAFSFDRTKLHLSAARVTDILDALTRKEVNYPLVVATPRTLTEAEQPHTLHRVLMDRLIRAMDIKVWQRTDPDVDTFLEQVRDCALGDLTLGPDGWRARGHTGVGPDGTPLVFTSDGWLPYLQALYPTLPRVAATPGYLDPAFVAWEQDPPASRVIPGAQESRGGQVTIQSRSQLDAVQYRYPLITPSRHLALFAQYHAATGEYLDTATWSWMFGIVDPERFPGRPSVHANWDAGGLNLCRNHPGNADAGGRLRSSR